MNDIIKIERQLCETGHTLNNAIDDYIAKARSNGAGSSDEIYQALQAYFIHRKICPSCKVRVWTIDGSK
ncbi:MAG: hypothetical protein KatS3mg054_0625 [Chloroflexus sp.]|nr:MAG: hypothetical protein KatS3mg054_0625 [Chloroflexus sp.]